MTDDERFDLEMSINKNWEETLKRTKEEYFQRAKWIVICAIIVSFGVGFCIGKGSQNSGRYSESSESTFEDR